MLALVSGRTILPLPPCQDHKAVFDGDPRECLASPQMQQVYFGVAEEEEDEEAYNEEAYDEEEEYEEDVLPG